MTNIAQEIPIIFITDNNYVLPTAVAINSLIKNKNEQNIYKIFVLYTDLSEENKNKFLEYNQTNVTVELIRPENSEYLLSVKQKRENDYVSPAVLFKFAIPKMFQNYEKVIYIDGDTLINGDLSDLYNTDIKDFYMGVVKDIHPIMIKAQERLNIETYFNAGVILYNIKKMLEDGIDEYLNSEEVLNKINDYFWFEQDTYNVLLNKKVKFLHPKYNFIVESWRRYGLNKSCKIFDIPKREGKLLFKNAIIFHLASELKPWVYQDGVMRDEWEKYYYSSPFTDLAIGTELHKPKNTFLENIFSVKTEQKSDKEYKVITILGIKLKIKVKKIPQNNNKISIITICYNSPGLEKTCESIVNQTNQDFEWIVIDGGSNENTQQIWNKYKYRINTFVSEKDNGIYNAYNKGLKYVSNEYVIFLNGGDNFHSLDVIENIFKKNLEGDIIYGSLFVNGKCENHNFGKITPKFFILGSIPTPATIIRKSLFDKYGNFSEEYRIVSDFEAFLKFSEHGASFKYIPIIISDFDTTGISSAKETMSLHNSERLVVLKQHFTQKDFEYAAKHQKLKNSLIENIFSIKNSAYYLYKVVTILGIQIKLKIKRKKSI